MSAIRVPWSSASFLVYLGGLTLFAALGSQLAVQADDYGSGGFVGCTVLVFLVTEARALALLVNGRRVTAGLLALSAVAAWVVFLGALLDWFGWLAHTDSPFAGFHVSHLFLELALVFAAAAALAAFRFRCSCSRSRPAPGSSSPTSSPAVATGRPCSRSSSA